MDDLFKRTNVLQFSRHRGYLNFSERASKGTSRIVSNPAGKRMKTKHSTSSTSLALKRRVSPDSCTTSTIQIRPVRMIGIDLFKDHQSLSSETMARSSNPSKMDVIGLAVSREAHRRILSCYFTPFISSTALLYPAAQASRRASLIASSFFLEGVKKKQLQIFIRRSRISITGLLCIFISLRRRCHVSQPSLCHMRPKGRRFLEALTAHQK